MTIGISYAQAFDLHHLALTNRGDPLSYRSFHGSDEDDEEQDECSAVSDMQELAHEALARSQPAVTRSVERWSTDRRMDVVTADLLIGLGIDPVAALVIDSMFSETGDGLSLTRHEDPDCDDGMRHDVARRCGPIWQVALDAAGDVLWHSDGVVSLSAIPDTIAVAAPGRPLREVLSHPVLDHFDIVVTSVTTGNGRSVVRVPSPLKLQRLELIAHARMRRETRQLPLAA